MHNSSKSKQRQLLVRQDWTCTEYKSSSEEKGNNNLENYETYTFHANPFWLDGLFSIITSQEWKLLRKKTLF